MFVFLPLCTIGTEAWAQNDQKADAGSDSTTGEITSPELVVAKPNYKLMQDDSSGIEIRFGYLWQGQSYPTTPTADAPNTNGIKASPLLIAGGVGVRIGIAPLLRFDPSLELTRDDYVYRADLHRAFPTQSMTGSSVGPVASVFGLLFTLPINFEVHVSDSALWEFGGGIAIYPHIITEVLDNSVGTDKIGDYLNGDLRWLYPMVSTGLQIGLSDWISAGLRFRVYLPLWHVWDSEDLPFWDNLLLNLQLDVTFHF